MSGTVRGQLGVLSASGGQLVIGLAVFFLAFYEKVKRKRPLATSGSESWGALPHSIFIWMRVYLMIYFQSFLNIIRMC